MIMQALLSSAAQAGVSIIDNAGVALLGGAVGVNTTDNAGVALLGGLTTQALLSVVVVASIGGRVAARDQ